MDSRSPSDPSPGSPVSLSSDTPWEVEERLLAAYRGMSDRERLRRIGDLGRLAENVALSEIRERHPSATPEELRLRLAARSFDRDTMIRAFGWDPAAHGA